MGIITRYLTSAALVLALGGASWGYLQERRVRRISAELAAAQAIIARLQAEAQTREMIDHAVDTVQRLDDGGIADWLRARAGGR